MAPFCNVFNEQPLYNVQLTDLAYTRPVTSYEIMLLKKTECKHLQLSAEHVQLQWIGC